MKTAAHDLLREDRMERYTHREATAVSLYICALGGVELVTIFFGALPGLCGNCLLLFAMLNHYLIVHPSLAESETDKDAPSSPACALPVFALAPLLRILSLVMPLRDIPEIYWYAFIGAPALVAALLTAHYLRLPLPSVGFSSLRWREQVTIAASGAPLGLIGFFLARPAPLTPSFQWRELVVGSAILVIFVGFTEEFIFRSLLLPVAPQLGGWIRGLWSNMGQVAGRMTDDPGDSSFEKAMHMDGGLFWSSAAFAIMSIGSRSFQYVLFVGLIGMFFGWCVQRTGSIWGVVAAHSALVVEALLIFPHVFN